MARVQPSPKAHDKPLTAKQEQALELKINGMTKAAICRELNISVATFHRWQQLPAWSLALNNEIDYLQGEGKEQIKALLPFAMRTLKQLMTTSTDQVKLGASRTLLEAWSALVSREETTDLMRDLEGRLEELQGLAGEQGLLPAKAEVQDAEIVVDANADANADADEVEVDF